MLDLVDYYECCWLVICTGLNVVFVVYRLDFVGFFALVGLLIWGLRFVCVLVLCFV